MLFLSLVLVAESLAAGEASAVIAVKLEAFRERRSSIYCSCNNIQGRDLVFDLSIENQGPLPVTLFAFVWATNDSVDPPERGLWPLEAVDENLTGTGELRVVDPTQGQEVTLKGGESLRLQSLAVLQPIGWYEGERVRFKRLKVELWDAEGKRLLEEDFPAPEPDQLPID